MLAYDERKPMKITVKRLDRLRAGQSISDTGLFARRQSEGGCHREEDRVDEDRNARRTLFRKRLRGFATGDAAG